MANSSQNAIDASTRIIDLINSIGPLLADQCNFTNLYFTHESTAEIESLLKAILKPVDPPYYRLPSVMPPKLELGLAQIYNWLEAPVHRTPNILWFHGSAGTGKSTVAASLVSNLAKMNRPVHSIATNDPATLWRTIAFDLARSNSVIAQRVAENVKVGNVDPMQADIESHFSYLILDPLMKFNGEVGGIQGMRFPVVIVDGLDECGSDSNQSAQQKILMATLTRWSYLPSSFKLVVTSRDEVPPVFRNICHHVNFDNSGPVSTDRDIRSFFERNFAQIVTSSQSLPHSWPYTSVIDNLTLRAAGLHDWAVAVIEFVRRGPPEGQLDLVLSGIWTRNIDFYKLTEGLDKSKNVDTDKLAREVEEEGETATQLMADGTQNNTVSISKPSMTALHTDKPEGGEKQIPIEEIPTTGIVGNEAAEQQAKEMYILARKDCADDCIFPAGDLPTTSSKRNKRKNSHSRTPVKASLYADRTEIYVDPPREKDPENEGCCCIIQ